MRVNIETDYEQWPFPKRIGSNADDPRTLGIISVRAHGNPLVRASTVGVRGVTNWGIF